MLSRHVVVIGVNGVAIYASAADSDERHEVAYSAFSPEDARSGSAAATVVKNVPSVAARRFRVAAVAIRMLIDASTIRRSVVRETRPASHPAECTDRQRRSIAEPRHARRIRVPKKLTPVIPASRQQRRNHKARRSSRSLLHAADRASRMTNRQNRAERSTRRRRASPRCENSQIRGCARSATVRWQGCRNRCPEAPRERHHV